MKLCNLDVILESCYNLVSITGLLEEDHLVKVNKKDGITAQKGGQVIKFDIRVKNPKGVLWCAYTKRKEPTESKIAAESSDFKSDNQPAESKKRLKSAIKMVMKRAHAILGHSDKDST
jgi:hypothetical protein